jgi:hypothetical protein
MKKREIIASLAMLLFLSAADPDSPEAGYLHPPHSYYEINQPGSDSRSSNNKESPSDEKITREVHRQLNNDWDLEDKKFKVKTKNGYVTVQGIVDDPSEAKRVIDIIENVDGVIGIKDELYSKKGPPKEPFK